MSPGDRRARCAFLVAAAAGAAALEVFDPALGGPFPRCPVHQFSGLWCPGCGTLRALHAILTGHPLDGLRFNALLVLTLPLVAWLAGRWVRGARVEVSPRLTRAMLVAALLFGLLRNLPVAPFSALAPG